MDRRAFVKHGSVGVASAGMINPLAGIMSQKNPAKSLGVALVGLGYYSEHKLAPGLMEAEHCHLAGIVTGTRSKIPQWKEKYGLQDGSIYSYDTFDQIASNDAIDIVYVVLPNSMHADFSIRAAQAGKHVICEKPMANSVAECAAIIEACDKAGVKLQIGYRLLYEPNTKEIYRLAREQVHGEVNFIESSNAFYAGNYAQNWRFCSPELAGGGPLTDMGVYSIHCIRHIMEEEPKAATAQAFRSRHFMFKGMEETILYQLYFPNGVIANCMTSYSARISRVYTSSSKGFFGLEPAFGYGPIKSFSSEGDISKAHTNHQAVQFDAFATNILEGTEVVASGLEGLLDYKVVEAVYRAMHSGKKELV